MPAPPRTPDAARLQQILQSELQGGFKNTAVLGGLDRFLAQWQAVPGFPAPQPSYDDLSPFERGTWVRAALLWVGGTPVTPAVAPSRPTGGASPARPRPVASIDKDGVRQLPAPKPAARGGLKVKPSPAVSGTGASAPKPAPRASRPASASAPGLDAPLPAVARARGDVLARLEKLGVKTLRDALYFFPRRHVDFSRVKSIAELAPGPEETVVGVVWQAREVSLGPRRKAAEITVGDETGNVRAIWFNQPYLVRVFTPGAPVMLSGRVQVFNARLVFESPEYELVDSQDGPADTLHTGRLVPIYPLTEGLSGRTVRRVLKPLVDAWASRVAETLPEAIRSRHAFMPLPNAVQNAHYPESWEAYEEARRRLAFDELFSIQLGALLKRREWQQAPARPIPAGGDVLGGFTASLPFTLTRAQERALQEITADLAGNHAMSRLLQGDVGSGKTVIAAAVLVLAVAAGYQGALMAPTEILAEQHYRNISRLLGHEEFEALEALPLPYLQGLGRPLRVGLLTGSQRAAEKRRVQEAAAAGALDVIIGTHALIQETVSFDRLAVAIIDEQHRFGVAQRAALRQKGHNPHVLVMTATPIPRTLALTLYGDLEVSVLDELPPGRQPIQTALVPARAREQAHGFLRQQVEAGRQAFVICPLIEESATVEARAAEAEHLRLSTEVFPDLRLGLLHGRMSPADKDRVMSEFRDGALHVLVSTSVVEVGIDVPNATVMLIEGADRFGLSQLHQLRGRVGRGEHQSYCLLLTDSDSPEAVERLQILASTQDGFRLAEEDLRLRGPGEYFGTRQTGLPELRMARLDDRELLQTARGEAADLLAAEPDLAAPELDPLRASLARLRPLGSADLS